LAEGPVNVKDDNFEVDVLLLEFLSMSHNGGCCLTRSSGACWRELHLDVELP
jgi:hypothetical protein